MKRSITTAVFISFVLLAECVIGDLSFCRLRLVSQMRIPEISASGQRPERITSAARGYQKTDLPRHETVTKSMAAVPGSGFHNALKPNSMKARRTTVLIDIPSNTAFRTFSACFLLSRQSSVTRNNNKGAAPSTSSARLKGNARETPARTSIYPAKIASSSLKGM